MQSNAPAPLPLGARLVGVSARGLTLACPAPAHIGSLIELDLTLGVRPVPLLARVTASQPAEAAHRIELEYVGLAQLDRDTIADFLTALGPGAVSIHEHRDV